jgi:hypothetical protein
MKYSKNQLESGIKVEKVVNIDGESTKVLQLNSDVDKNSLVSQNPYEVCLYTI